MPLSHLRIALAAALLLPACSDRPAAIAPEPVSELSAPGARAPAPSASAAPVLRTSLVRERREVVVRGVKEEWRIEWVEQPELSCFSNWACPCQGFELGETGAFDLVRTR